MLCIERPVGTEVPPPLGVHVARTPLPYNYRFEPYISRAPDSMTSSTVLDQKSNTVDIVQSGSHRAARSIALTSSFEGALVSWLCSV